MEQARLIRAGVLAVFAAAFCGFPSAPEIVWRPLFDDLEPVEVVHAPRSGGLLQFLQGLVGSSESSERCSSASLKTLAAAEADFRGCDRDSNVVNDFWTADVAGLYTLTPTEPASKSKADFRANDRDGCGINDFWTASVGLYQADLTEIESAVTLIELSIAASEKEDP